MPTSVQAESFFIPVFYVMLGAGTLGMLLSALRRRERFLLSRLRAVFYVLLLTLVGVIGARLLYILENGQGSGVSFYGSVFLIPLLMPLLGRALGLRFWQTMDLCGPCVAIMIGCMRVGCFLTGCCGGWKVCIGNLCFAWPTQVMDSIGDFVILGWLMHLEERGKGNGRLYPLFMIAYSVMRFFLEFLRDTPKDVFGMSNGQWYALVAAAAGLLWVMILKGKEKRL